MRMNRFFLSVPALPPGVPRADGYSRPDTLCAQSVAHHCAHPGCVCVPGSSVQWPDLHLHLPTDEGAVEPRCRPACSLLHRHCSRLHLTLGCRFLRQWRHRHLCPAVHLLPLGMSVHSVLPTIMMLKLLSVLLELKKHSQVAIQHFQQLLKSIKESFIVF